MQPDQAALKPPPYMLITKANVEQHSHDNRPGSEAEVRTALGRAVVRISS